MATEGHQKILRDKSVVKLDNYDFSDASISKINLSYRSFTNSDFSGCEIIDCKITNSDFSKANMQKAKFHKAKMTASVFRETDFSAAKFTNSCVLQNVDATNANFFNADLRGVKLQNAKLRGANLRGANLEKASVQGADLAFCLVDEKTKLKVPKGWFVDDGKITNEVFKEIESSPKNYDPKEFFHPQNLENIKCLSMVLSQTVRIETENLKHSKPNDPEKIAEYNHLIEFLHLVEKGLDLISEALNQNSLSRAKKATSLIGMEIEEFLIKQNVEIADWAVRVPAAAGGIALLGAAGASMPIATTFVTALVGGQKVVDAIKPK